MTTRIALMLAPLAVAFVGVLPAAAAAPAAELLVLQGPSGFERVPTEAGIIGPVDLQTLAAFDGIKVPRSVQSLDGFSRAWTRDQSALVGYALTFSDDATAAAVVDDITGSLSANNITPLPGSLGGIVATITEQAAYTSLEFTVFRRGSAVFAFVGSGVDRDVVIDAAVRQDIAIGLPTSATAAGLGLPGGLTVWVGALIALAVAVPVTRRLRATRRPVAPLNTGWSTGTGTR